jgi:hypothetical protein
LHGLKCKERNKDKRRKRETEREINRKKLGNERKKNVTEEGRI